ncbi:cation acetate symporter [Streptomyces avermitilis]|uniref:Sodium:solute symporter n=3 Tax=Streptomyces avermitilis TaxID=33903 RepID=Q82ND3_STRAW|nr:MULTISPECIES: cation acetate symporter [Streptomyces]KUN55203.1 cation acetate symporter [Streptomyces avermitilis]MYS96999.1 cation acetate symporter [Streptomyces sp. SID5469]OOV26690.1 cation acetate symporter [Streptomyces avermitilis]BAC69080.1 putative sodium:solute symporter [Streptomyces avermitilis MA-4680 = NBRC 14893]GDY61067.1 cation acetate symporter [Streptomyces avermitilis]
MNDFSSGTQATVLILFTALVTLTLLMCVMAGPDRDDLTNFYTGYLSLTPLKNGLAIAGDYISAATVLSTTGIIALAGYDGDVLAVSTAMSLVLLMFLLAEPLRNAGRFTMGDVLARNMPGRAVRIASCVVTLAATLPFLVVQLSGAGSLLTFILGIPHLSGARTVCIVLVGSLMIIYAAIGGMRGTALIQMIKIVLLLGTSVALAALVLNRFDWNPGDLLRAAQRGSGAGPAFLQQGLQLGTSAGSRLDFVSLQITVVLGVACLPHITMRLFSARDVPAVRRSMSWAVGTVTTFCLLVIVMGTGAAALVGSRYITAADPHGRTSVLMLSQVLGGDADSAGATILYAAMAGTVFITLLSSVAGMTLAAASSLAHDLFAHAARRGQAAPRTEMTVAAWTSVAVGTVAITLSTLVQHWDVGVLTTLAICIGASAVAPALTYSLFWRGFTRTGLLGSLYGGAACALVLMVFSQAVSGTPSAVFPKADFALFPMQSTGLVSIPFGYLAGWLGSRLDRRRRAAESRENQRLYEESEARLLAAAE